eukprot:3292399-Prymnesium_polylepis.2
MRLGPAGRSTPRWPSAIARRRRARRCPPPARAATPPPMARAIDFATLPAPRAAAPHAHPAQPSPSPPTQNPFAQGHEQGLLAQLQHPVAWRWLALGSGAQRPPPPLRPCRAAHLSPPCVPSAAVVRANIATSYVHAPPSHADTAHHRPRTQHLPPPLPPLPQCRPRAQKLLPLAALVQPSASCCLRCWPRHTSAAIRAFPRPASSPATGARSSRWRTSRWSASPSSRRRKATILSARSTSDEKANP